MHLFEELFQSSKRGIMLVPRSFNRCLHPVTHQNVEKIDEREEYTNISLAQELSIYKPN